MKSMICGTNKALMVRGSADDHGELEVVIASMPDDAYTWINKEDAIKLIAHLENVFDIN